MTDRTTETLRCLQAAENHMRDAMAMLLQATGTSSAAEALLIFQVAVKLKEARALHDSIVGAIRADAECQHAKA